MRRSKSLVLFAAVAFGALCGAARAQVPTLPPDGGTRIDPPTCSLRNAAGPAATEFGTGEEFVLGGTRFPADELVLVTFRQPPRVVELARFRTNAQGDFTSRPTVLRIPADADGGPAAIGLASSGGSATCDLRVQAGPAAATQPEPAPTGEDSEDDLGPWFIVWAVLLALGACYLGYVRYRRWQERRLEQEIARINTGAPPTHREPTPLPPPSHE